MIRPGIVSHVKNTGQVAVSDHTSALPVNPTPYRSYIGGRKSGFHSAPKVGDTVVLLYGPNNRLLSIVPFLDANTKTDGMYTLQPGESAEYHSDGRVAGYLPNTGGGTIYNDPNHTVSLLANALGFALTGKLVGGDLQPTTVEVGGNETVGGTLTVTGAVTVTGQINANGGIVIGGATVGGLQSVSGSVSGATCTITFPHGLSLTINGTTHVVPLLT